MLNLGFHMELQQTLWLTLAVRRRNKDFRGHVFIFVKRAEHQNLSGHRINLLDLDEGSLESLEHGVVPVLESAGLVPLTQDSFDIGVESLKVGSQRYVLSKYVFPSLVQSQWQVSKLSYYAFGSFFCKLGEITLKGRYGVGG